jgi:putative Holliday junction resolvase
MRYLAVDFGTRRLGLAVSDETGTLASPYAARERQGTRRDVAEIIRTARGLGAQTIIVGRPRHLQSGETGSSEAGAQAFVTALETALQEAKLLIAIERWDERFSTREALNQMRESGISQLQGRQASDANSTDARAAAVILQGFLDAQRNHSLNSQPTPETDEALREETRSDEPVS